MRGFAPLLLILATYTPLAAEEVTVAIFDGAAPISFTNESGEADGIMPAILNRILEDLGHDATFVTDISFQQAYERVVSGEIDILPAAVYSEERARVLDYNEESFVVSWGQLGVLPNTDLEGLLSLRDKRIGLMRDGQNAANFVDLMSRFDIPFQPVYYATFPEIAQAVESGTVTAGVFFSTWFRSAKGIVPSSIVFTPTQGFIATARGTNGELFEAINRRLVELKHDDGSYYYEMLNYWLSQDTPVRIPRWVWIAIGVTAAGLFLALTFVVLLRKEVMRATKELEMSRQRYKTIADYAHGWEFWDDASGNQIYVSPNTVEITGYEAKQFLIDPGLEERIIVEDDHPIWHAHIAEVQGASTDVDRSNCTFRIRTADGDIRWIEHRCVRVESATGAYLGRRGSNIDITERVVQEQALERSLLEKEVMYAGNQGRRNLR